MGVDAAVRSGRGGDWRHWPPRLGYSMPGRQLARAVPGCAGSGAELENNGSNVAAAEYAAVACFKLFAGRALRAAGYGYGIFLPGSLRRSSGAM